MSLAYKLDECHEEQISVSTVGAGAVDWVKSFPIGSGPFLSAAGQAVRVKMKWFGVRSTDNTSFAGEALAIVDLGNGGEQSNGTGTSVSVSATSSMFAVFNGTTVDVKYRNGDGGMTTTHNVFVEIDLSWVG